MSRATQDKAAEQIFYDHLFARRQRFDQFQDEIYESIAQEARAGTSGDQALELGCGSGSQALCLMDRGFTVVGIDLSLQGLRVARAATNSAGREAWLLNGDAEQVPLSDQSFHVCVCGLLLHHFTDFGRVADEISRLLRPGGIVVALDVNAHNPFAWFHFTVLHRIRKNPRLTANQRALRKSEIVREFSCRGFDNFRFRSVTSELRRDWLENSLRDRLYHRMRASMLGLSNALLPQLSRGNMLLSTFRKRDGAPRRADRDR